MRKHLKRWLIGLLVLAILMMMFIPVIPSNAVRLCILENGHPIAALLAGPRKLPQSAVDAYSGKKDWLYYQVNVPFSTASADVTVVAVHTSGQRTWGKFVGVPAYDLGP